MLNARTHLYTGAKAVAPEKVAAYAAWRARNGAPSTIHHHCADEPCEGFDHDEVEAVA